MQAWLKLVPPQMLSHVQGYLVPIPLEFLSGEDLLPLFGAKVDLAALYRYDASMIMKHATSGMS